MKRRFVSLLCVGLVAGVLAGCGEGENIGVGKRAGDLAKLKDIKAEELTADLDVDICFDVNVATYGSVHGFSYELMKQNLKEENPVLSPVSAYLALAMAGNGARGETLEEFRVVLGDNLTTIPYDILQGLQREEDGMTISLANSAWVDDQMEAADTFLAAMDSYFDAEVYQRKLSTKGAMDDMNIWINAKTNGMIPSMINEPLDEDSRLVLFNTIYFNGKWARKFKGYDTRSFDFTMEDGQTVATDMMQMRETDQLYVKNDIAEGVILPYEDERIAFLALMPIGEADVREMYEQLTWEDICSLLEQEETTLCNLRLPKFEVTFEKELNESLKAMGLVKAFDDSQADLSGLGNAVAGGNLYISLVKQKAVLILDEEGTEASAATMVEIKKECAIEYETPPVNVYFDEPFLYMIIDKTNDVPLFMGIMDNPEI